MNEAAESAAQSVVEHERSLSRARRKPGVEFVPLLYRFKELRGVDLRDQRRLIRQAGSMANREVLVVLACLVWIALVLGVAFVGPTWLHGFNVAPVVPVLAVPFILVQRARVKYHAVQLLYLEAKREELGT